MHTKKIVILIIFCITLIVGCSTSLTTSNKIAISVVKPTLKDIEITQNVVGNLTAINAPTISAETSGRIIKVLVNEGQSVAAGDVLAEIDPVPLQLALQSSQADVERLDALATNEQLKVQRYTEALKLKSIPQILMDEANAQLRSYRAQLLAAQVNVESHQIQLSKTKILAPFAGTIQKKIISEGDFIDTGKPAFQFVASQRLRAIFAFPETQVDLLYKGQPVSLSLAINPNQKVMAQVTEIVPMLNEKNRAISINVDFDNPGNWRAGSSINGVILFKKIHNASFLPEQSVVTRKAGLVIYAIKKDKTAKAIPVEVGEFRNGMIQINTPLPDNLMIANNGAAFLEEGVSVNITSREGNGK
jgi:RND family efflux transporter MFP subunit